jgi:hypothetical protein
MSSWIETLNGAAAAWLEAVVRASWQGGLALTLAWGLTRLLPGLPASARGAGVPGIRLYATTWENPRPGVEVLDLDYVSLGRTAAAPFCVAITCAD